MQAFHFTSAKVALMIIEKQQLKVSLFDDLNDPFELYAMELTDGDQRTVFREFKDQAAKKVGLLCFSKKWSNPVLWSHYADRYKGVALQFHVSSKDIHKIDYTPKRLRQNFAKVESKLSNGDLEDNDIKVLLTTKVKHWIYEEEIRKFVNLGKCVKDKGMYFHKFGSNFKVN